MSLVITKESGNLFSLSVDGGFPIRSETNRLTTFGDYCNFKTANGANLILKQNVLYSEITIVTNVSYSPTSIDDLWNYLNGIGFFNGINGTGNGSATDKFTDLLDTFPSFIGRDGQLLVVNESQQRIETIGVSVFSEADRIKLDNIEENAEVNVQADASVSDPNDPAYIKNFPENFGVLNIPVIIDAIIGVTAGFIVGQQDFDIPARGIVTDVILSHSKQYKATPNNASLVNRWSQAGTVLTITKVPALNNYIYIEYIST